MKLQNKILPSLSIIVIMIVTLLPAPFVQASHLNSPEQTEPVIDIWYGPTQNFGQIGNPQLMINILGNVSDPDVDASLSLVYSLNGGPEVPLSLGPDNRRLDEPGDFNVDIQDFDLLDGTNQVVITATDIVNNDSSVVPVTLEYSRDNVWPLPYSTDWGSGSAIQDQAQIIDGQWSIASGAIRPDELGYDRIVGLGDISWEDYEVTVPVTIHSVETGGPNSGPPAVGAIIRWQGNSNDPDLGIQPISGYYPWGAIMWYRWFDNPPISNNGRLQILGNEFVNIAQDLSGRKLSFGVTYIFKMRVESVPGSAPNYKFKVWDSGLPEPTDWDLTGQGQLTDPENGFVAMMSHHADVSYGDVTVVPLGDPPPASTIVSDDFNVCALDTDVWTFVDPVGDSTHNLVGSFTNNAWLNIIVPSGSNHNPGLNLAPRLTQSVNDTDFQVETKFESGMSLQYQMEGIIIEEDDDTYMRFEYFSDGNRTRRYTAAYDGGVLLAEKEWNEDLTGRAVAPLYMRVRRSGNRWTQWYSLDGANWTSILTFNHPIAVSSVGPYVSNSTGSGGTPGFTGSVDYFFNTDVPIVPEDGARNTLSVNVVGNGSATRDPSKNEYSCGEQVTLTANPDPGWEFSQWSGDIIGTANPITTTMTGPKVVTATLTQEGYTLTVDTVGQGAVDVDPDQSTFTYGQEVTLTATADTGWEFTGWSGDLTGTMNPITTTMTESKVVTATFSQEGYTLTVDTVGQGSVDVNPDQPIYTSGELVTLTATADPGWEFTGWSGDASGNQNPLVVTMNDDTVITANFSQESYVLNVSTSGQGTVTIIPQKPTYVYGDIITLTAIPGPGLSFLGWSGDASGKQNPLTLTMTADTTVVARFGYPIFIPIVMRGP